MANMAKGLSTKHALLDKTNSTVVVIVSIAIFVTIFSLVATKSLVSQARYQNRVYATKKVARDQLKSDVDVIKKLKPAYNAFVGTQINIIGGNSLGTGPRDGDNAKIILDALPSRYDFPALTTNLDTLVGSQGAHIVSISGTDDEVVQATNTTSTTPTPVAMPFQLTVSGDYDRVKNTIGAFEKSIRPIQLQTLTLSGDQTNLTLSLSAQTYYQPAKSLNIGKEVVK